MLQSGLPVRDYREGVGLLNVKGIRRLDFKDTLAIARHIIEV
jgi:hypothetical protein